MHRTIQMRLRYYVRCPEPGCHFEDASDLRFYLAGRLCTHTLAAHGVDRPLDMDAALAQVEDTLSEDDAYAAREAHRQPTLFDLHTTRGNHHAA